MYNIMINEIEKEKEQFCAVKNKSQLLAAFRCAIGFYGKTQIQLHREKGVTTFTLKPMRPYYERFDKSIKKRISIMRGMKARYFK